MSLVSAPSTSTVVSPASPVASIAIAIPTAPTSTSVAAGATARGSLSISIGASLLVGLRVGRGDDLPGGDLVEGLLGGLQPDDQEQQRLAKRGTAHRRAGMVPTTSLRRQIELGLQELRDALPVVAREP